MVSKTRTTHIVQKIINKYITIMMHSLGEDRVAVHSSVIWRSKKVKKLMRMEGLIEDQ